MSLLQEPSELQSLGSQLNAIEGSLQDQMCRARDEKSTWTKAGTDLELLATKMQLLTRRLVDAEAAKSEALGRIVEVEREAREAGMRDGARQAGQNAQLVAKTLRDLEAKIEAQAQAHDIEIARLTNEATQAQERLRLEREEFSAKALTIAKGGEAFTDKVQGLTMKLAAAEKQVQDLSSQLQQDQEAAARSDMEVTELGGVVERLEQQLTQSQHDLHTAQDVNRNQQHHIQEANGLKEKVHALQEELRQKEGVLVEKERMIFRIVGEKKKVVDQLQADKDACRADREELEALRTQHQASTALHADQLQQLKAANQELQSDMEASQMAQRELQERMQQSQAKEKEMRAALEKVTAEKTQQQQQLEATRLEVENQTTALSRRAGCDAIEEELSRVKKAKLYMESEMERRIYDLQAQVKETREKGLAQIERIKKERDDLSAQLKETRIAVEERREAEADTNVKTLEEVRSDNAQLESLLREHQISSATVQELVRDELSRLNAEPMSPQSDDDSAPSTPRRGQDIGRQDTAVVDALRKSVNGIDGFSLVEELRSIQALEAHGSSPFVRWIQVCDQLGLLQEAIQEHKQYFYHPEASTQCELSVISLMGPVKMAIEESLSKDPAHNIKPQRNTVCRDTSLDSAELVSLLVWGYHELLQAVCTLCVANTMLGSRLAGQKGLDRESWEVRAPEQETQSEPFESEKRLEAQEVSNQELQRENKTLQAKYDAVTQHYQAVLGQLAALQSEHVELDALRKACDEAHQQVRALRLEQDTARGTICSLEQDLHVLEMEKVALTQKCSAGALTQEHTARIKTLESQLKMSQTQLAAVTTAEEKMKKELTSVKAAHKASQASVKHEELRSAGLEKELATLQKAFTEAQQLLQGKLTKLQEAFADENKALRQKLADATKVAAVAPLEEAAAVNQSTSSNEAQELEVHYTRLMAAQQFEFSKERDELNVAIKKITQERASLAQERDGLLENMHSLASDVEHLEEQLAKAEQDLRQALYYIQENDKSVLKNAEGSALHQQLKTALKDRDSALAAVQRHSDTMEATQAEYEVKIQHLLAELDIYKEAVNSHDGKGPGGPGTFSWPATRPNEHAKVKDRGHYQIRPAKQADHIIRGVAQGAELSAEHHIISAGVA